jgi:hypothetical protein
MSASMQESVVNFLVRMAALLGESRDKDLLALHRHTQALVSDALQLWPQVRLFMMKVVHRLILY